MKGAPHAWNTYKHISIKETEMKYILSPNSLSRLYLHIILLMISVFARGHSFVSLLPNIFLFGGSASVLGYRVAPTLYTSIFMPPLCRRTAFLAFLEAQKGRFL